MQNYKLTICYDGTRYRGWQKQGNTDNTIQAKLEALLSRLLGQPVEVNGSGRTDAGVHARRQVCSFRGNTDLNEKELLKQIRSFLPEDIGAVSLECADPRFHARLQAVGKTYLYRIWNSSEPNVFDRRYIWQIPEKLDEDAMKRGAQLLSGTHDFSSFQANKHFKKSAVRTIYGFEFKHAGGNDQELQIYVTGDGFLYNMVRILVGTLVEIGRGERRPEEIPDLLKAENREAAGMTAPAKGLTLWDVYYDTKTEDNKHEKTVVA